MSTCIFNKNKLDLERHRLQGIFVKYMVKAKQLFMLHMDNTI